MIQLDNEGRVRLMEQKLMTGRTCIIGQSGSGKSYAIAVICEQLCKSNLGFVVIDTEGEYSSLKDKFEVIIGSYAGEGDLNLRSVDFNKLSYQLIKNNTPFIFDVSEAENQQASVSRFLKSLYEQASTLMIPYLIIIEEADKFCPQRGVSIPEIKEISSRGRKRGAGLLVASQRPALIDKAVLSQCNIQLIGRLTIENDVDAVRSFINNRAILNKLPELESGQFVISGLGEDLIFKFKDRLTVHKSAAPEIKKLGSINLTKESLGIKSRELSDLTGVKPAISLVDANNLINKNLRRRFLLFGSKEEVSSINLVYNPLIQFQVKIKKKLISGGSASKQYLYFNDYTAVNNKCEKLFNLSFLKELSIDEVKVLLSILYDSGAKNIGRVIKSTGFVESRAGSAINNLLKLNLITDNSKSGRLGFQAVNGVHIPRIKSLFQEPLKPEINPEFLKKPALSHDELISVIKLLDDNAEILESKTLYYPFYEVTLRKGDSSRNLLINGVTGKVF